MVVDLSSISTDMLGLLKAGQGRMEEARRLIDEAPSKSLIPLSECELLSPITGAGKVICIGMNYREHCIEQNFPIPKEPVVFSKFGSSITGPNSPVYFDSGLTQCMDFEVELAVVVGKSCRNTSREKAISHIAGVTVAHDVSARDWQLERNGGQWLLGKAMDSFCPLGPHLVTVDEDGGLDLDALRVMCRLNGETVQDSTTKEFIFDVPMVIEYLSKFCTLEPGDVILTGTPSGVGCFRKPPLWLKHGDVVECEIEGIGTVRNLMVDSSRESHSSGAIDEQQISQMLAIKPTKSTIVPMFIGTYTGSKPHVDGKGRGVYPCSLDLASGEMLLTGKPFPISNPTFLCLNRDKTVLHAVSEDDSPSNGVAATGTVTSFHLSGSDAEESSTWVSFGTDPCYLEMDRDERFCFVANYSSGSVSVFPVRPDRSLGPSCCFRQHKPFSPEQVLPGPVKERQEGPHAHQARIMEDRPTGKTLSSDEEKIPLPWLYVPDLGLDKVVQYHVEMTDGSLTEIAAHDMPPGSGPRHLDWLPGDRSFAYVSLEMGNAVCVCSVDSQSGALRVVETISTLPDDCQMVYPENSVAQLLVHPSGSFLYVSNRGHDSIACFAIEKSSGRLTPKGHFSTNGECPRFFGFPAQGNLCIVANQDGHSCLTYHVNTSTGALTPTGHTLSVPSPVCCEF